MGRRSGRAAARRAAAALESTPRNFVDDEDEPMPDADEPDVEEHKDDDDEEEEGADKDESDAEEAEVEADEEEAEESAKEPTPPPEPVIRRRRLGRPPKNRPPDWDTLPIERPEDRDPNATPRRRGRGGWRGRGGRKGQHSTPTTQSIDKEGTTLPIVNDEVELPEDPEGETKVDKNGNLLGGRKYRCRTFKIVGRGERLYMLSTEPARCVGFRDSYLFFTKHKKLYKIIIDDDEKKDLIDRELIPHSYKGRTIGICTARSVFREFGSLIVVGGRRIIDDYEVAKAREEGVTEGEIADPLDVFEADKEYNVNQYVAWHGASSVYHSAGAAQPLPTETFVQAKKRRVAVNDVNWQLEHAREASRFNSMLSHARRTIQNGVYEINTNLMFYPASMQPTHARIEYVDDEKEVAKDVTKEADEETDEKTTIFPPLQPIISRNYLVQDFQMEQPSAGISQVSYEVPFRTSPADRAAVYQSDFLAPFRGLEAVSDEIKDLLPPECRFAFDQALKNEQEWHAKWGDEADTKCRSTPVIDKAIVPYSMHP